MSANPDPLSATPRLTEPPLRRGRTFTVHRGRLPGGEPVICKTASGRSWSADAVARLENEFAITRGRTHPGQTVARDLIHTDRGPMLIFEDEGLRSLDGAALPLGPSAVTRIALALAPILADLHGVQGIIHRDIKPSNVLADRAFERVKLIDYCLAIRAADLAAEQPGAFAAKGTVAYMAPEQSGRTNRQVDWRADLYSLGAMLYELLTGRPPFAGDDAATLFHRHLTEVPRPPHEVRSEIPRVLSDAVMRLLAKNPEDRFQSAAELARALQGGGPAMVAAPGRLRIPTRLYGRATLVTELTELVGDPARGRSRLLRIAGQSGIGKSALLTPVRAAVEAGGGHFIHGKFDQLDRARPYAPFAQAFNALLRTLLAGSAESLEGWRGRLLDALSPNAQVLLDLLPSYRALLGPQPPVARLGLNEAQIRMSLVFRRFVGALAREEAPLVLFIDDLQWSDSASRALMELILSDPEIRHLTLITAYRDNEVGPGHPVNLLFSALEDRIGLEPLIQVGPLHADSVGELLADTLGGTHDQVAPLASLVTAKTGGNPFFVRQFLYALQRNGLLRFDPASQGWAWDAEAIAREPLTDNVAELVVERILELPAHTRSLVQLAACIGNQVDLEILALVAESTPEGLARELEAAGRAEVLLPSEGGTVGGSEPPRDPSETPRGPPERYRFQHDRVQQAAYGLLSAERRSELHARIGGILLRKIPDPAAVGRLVEIADHLIAGKDRLDAEIRPRLREMALQAAQRTRSANAYDAALVYLRAAEETLGPAGWQDEPALAFRIALEQAEAAYLQGRTEDAESIALGLLDRGLPELDQVRALGLLILIHTSRLAYRAALEVGLRALALLGERLPPWPGPATVLTGLARTKLMLATRRDEDLRRLAHMTDPHKRAAMQIMVLLSPPAYFSAPNLLPLIALRMVRLSVHYGNAPESAYAYALYGMLHCAVLGAPGRGLAYGDLARELCAALDARDIEARILMIYAGFIQHWSAPLSDTLPVFLEGADKAIGAGDLEHHGYTRYGHASYAFMSGMALPKVSEHLERHLAAVIENRHEKTRRIMLMALGSLARMRQVPGPEGQTSDREREDFALWTEQRDATSLAYFHKFKMLEALMRGDYPGVLAGANGMEANLNGILGMAYQPFYKFYKALALIEIADRTRDTRAAARRFIARRLTGVLAGWARHGPRTLRHRVLLLRAELAAGKGRTRKAMALFEQAVAGARRAGARHDVGLFLERAARFYLAQGAEAAAAGYLSEATTAHRLWGAQGWVQALAERYPDLVRATAPMAQASDSDSTSSSGQTEIVDSATLIRAAAALTSKVSLKAVVTEVMRAVVVNAGATRGVLLLKDGTRLAVAAEADGDGSVRLLREQPAGEFTALPQGLINFVERAGERVVIDDAGADHGFGSDPWMRARTGCSMLCVPLRARGEVSGIVYLENDRVRGAFHLQRCVTVETLGAQAAVSIENARLYDSLRGSLETQVQLTHAHARFVPHQFLETLGRPSIADIKLGDHVQAKASILFSDIRGFTSLVEGMNPVEAIRFINTYLSKMEPAVVAGGGFVDSYVGDAVMAVFDRGADAAVSAGIEMLRSLGEWQRMREAAGEPLIRIGVGIATGDMIFGTIGAANRLKCGVIGDTVNLAARIETLTKRYGLGLLIAGRTRKALADPARYLIREVDLVTVAGREAPVRLHEVFDADPPHLRDQKLATRESIARGLALYREGAWDAAQALFAGCETQAPDDPLPALLGERCRWRLGSASSAEWNGIERIAEK